MVHISHAKPIAFYSVVIREIGGLFKKFPPKIKNYRFFKNFEPLNIFKKILRTATARHSPLIKISIEFQHNLIRVFRSVRKCQIILPPLYTFPRKNKKIGKSGQNEKLHFGMKIAGKFFKSVQGRFSMLRDFPLFFLF